MSKLAELLSEAPLAGSERARERTVALATAEVGRTAGKAPSGGSWLRASWPRLGMAGLVAAAVLVSPPGRDAVSWATDLVGIGDSPTVTDRPADLGPTGEQVVIGTGTAPDGTPYELVAYATDSHGEVGRSCIWIDYPQIGGPGAGSCGALVADDPEVLISGVHFPAPDSPGSSNAFLDGSATPDVRRVSIRLSRGGTVIEALDADVAILDGELQRRVGAAHPAARFFAFLPHAITADVAAGDVKIEAVAFGDDGTPIARDEVISPGLYTAESKDHGAG